MKKRLLSVLMVAVMLMAALPVSAADKELTDIDNAGSTSVEADIVNDDSGDVSYIIAIPEKIDFGTLSMPEDDATAHPKTVGFEVSAVEVNGLDTATSRIAVLMADASAEAGTFQIVGVSGTNNDKILKYSVLNSAGVDITSGNRYENGYAITAFSAAGQKVTGSLSLEQNQLLSDTAIENWAGDYLGTINFYTTIADLASYN